MESDERAILDSLECITLAQLFHILEPLVKSYPDARLLLENETDTERPLQEEIVRVRVQHSSTGVGFILFSTWGS